MQRFIKWATAEDPGKRTIWIVPVVNPQGTIKYIRASPSIQGQIVHAIFDETKQQPVLVDIGLQPGLADQGWVLLADLYRQESLMGAWDRFRQWMAQGPMVGGGKVQPGPDKYLPRAVMARREGKAEHQGGPEEIVIPEMEPRPADDPPPQKPSKRRDEG